MENLRKCNWICVIAIVIAIVAVIIVIVDRPEEPVVGSGVSGPTDEEPGSRRFDRVTFNNTTGTAREVTIELYRHNGQKWETDPNTTGTIDLGTVMANSSKTRVFAYQMGDLAEESVWRAKCIVKLPDNKKHVCEVLSDKDVYGDNQVHLRTATFWMAMRVPLIQGVPEEEWTEWVVGQGIMSNDRVARHLKSEIP